ncbi:MAG TPA: TonB-dependent receptor [Gemmatimonadaceae bacterium]|nr:TonB-dependent receptor [Gemmatimonadaceae bacterium]
MRRRLVMMAAAAAVAVACPMLARAQGAGQITGTVADGTRLPVTGAVVHLQGTQMGALTSGDGRYEVRQVPAGAYTLVVSAPGFVPDSSSVRVRDGAVVLHDVVLRASVATLAAVVSQASPRLNETKQAALAQEKAAPNIMNVMSGDEIRALPNANAAEAAGRIPGVSTERDEGEGKFVQIRGTEPRLSNVTIDGVHVPGTEGGDRIPKLDAVPSDLLGAIQVSKTLRADMDADAIGGSVNLVTKVPEGAPRGYIAAQGGRASLLARTNGQIGAGYGGRVGDDGALGFLINGSYDRNNRSIDDVEWGWNVDGNGRSYPVEWDQRDYLYGRIRYGAGGDLDYHFKNGSKLFLKGLWSQFDNLGLRYRFDVAASGDSALAATPTGGIGTGATLLRETASRTPHEQMYGFTTGGSSPVGNLDLDYTLNYSGTQQSIKDYRTNDFGYDGPGGNGFNVKYNDANRAASTYSYTSASDAALASTPGNFSMTRYSLSDGLTTAHDLGGAVNAHRTYGSGADSDAVQFGVKLRDEHRSYYNQSQRYAPASTFLMSQVLGTFSDPSFYAGHAPGFFMGPQAANGLTATYEANHASAFTDKTNALSDSSRNFSGSERILAAYAMNTKQYGNLMVNVGLRLEQTHSEYSGNVLTTPTDSSGNPTGPTVLSRTTGTKSYLDVFPSLQLRYAVTPSADLRFAVTRGIARPNYSDLAPHLAGQICANCAHRFGNLSAGNPDLHAQHAWNYDLLFSDYLSATGVFSAGLFYKQISDFIYDREFVYNGPVTEFQGYYGTQPANGGDAHLSGLEMDYTDRLRFLPGAWSGLGFDVNWTHVDSRANILADTASTAGGLGSPIVARVAPLQRTSPNLANVALTYDHGRLSARAAWQYQGANIADYGDGTATANGDNYFYAHSQIDASVILTVASDVQVQLQGLDLNDAVFGFFNGTPSQRYAVQREFYGRTIILGTKIGF